MVAGLCSDDLLLNTRQQLLRFGRRQTQLRDIAEARWPVDLRDVGTPGSAIDPRSDQPQNTPHPPSPGRQNARPGRTAPIVIPQFLDTPIAD